MAVEKVDFNFIRYANCWEDPEVLISGLSSKKGNKLLSIGSAGDNSFALLTTEPSTICVIDINPSQLHLIELKKAAIQYLTYNEVLYFIGYTEEGNISRQILYKKIKGYLTPEAQRYWNAHLSIIENGLIFSGKFEKYFIFFCTRLLPFIHTKRNIRKLLEQKTESEQNTFYQKHWNTWRWKLLFQIFFSRYVMGRWGRDPEFFQEVKIPVSKYIYLKAQKHLQSSLACKNELLHFTLTGHFKPYMPYYLRTENYDRIKLNLHKIELRFATIEQLAKEDQKFDGMNLSNIFEYMDKKMLTDVANQIDNISNSKCRLVYWNLMVPRRISKILENKFIYLDSVSKNLCEKDKGFFYNQVVVDEKL